jgi:hypothetical protein
VKDFAQCEFSRLLLATALIFRATSPPIGRTALLLTWFGRRPTFINPTVGDQESFPAFTLFKDRLNQGLKPLGSLPQLPIQLEFDTRIPLVFLGNRPTNRYSINQVPAHKAGLLCDDWAPVSVRAPIMFHFGHPGYDALKSPQTSVALSPFEQRANHRLCVLPPDKGHVWNIDLARDHCLRKPKIRQKLDELGLDFSGVLGWSPSLAFTMQCWDLSIIQ